MFQVKARDGKHLTDRMNIEKAAIIKIGRFFIFLHQFPFTVRYLDEEIKQGKYSQTLNRATLSIMNLCRAACSNDWLIL